MNNPLIKENEGQKITPKKEDQSVAQWLKKKIVGQLEYRFNDAVRFFGAKEVVY